MQTNFLDISPNRQKSYAESHRRDLQFKEGDKAFLKVSPTMGTLRFGQNGKLSRRYIGPYDIMSKIGNVAYRLALYSSMCQCDIMSSMCQC